MTTLYRIKDWDEHFESAKSRSVKHPSWCPIPNKQDGLGYTRAMQLPNAAALYGAFIALVLRLSKSKERQGYLTDNGGKDGNPIMPEDIEAITKIPAEIIAEMISAYSSEHIGWIISCDGKDTTRIPQGYHEDTMVSRQGPEVSISRTEQNRTEGTEQKGGESRLPAGSESNQDKIDPQKYHELEQACVSLFGNVPANNLTQWLQAHDPPWIMRAIREAEARNKRHVNYTDSILARWKREGYPEDEQPGKHHSARGDGCKNSVSEKTAGKFAGMD